MSNEKDYIEEALMVYNSHDFEAYHQKERHEMLKYIPQEISKVLDVGCAVGSFGFLLKSQRHLEIWGIEPNEYAASMAAKKLDKVVCSTFDSDSNLPANSFDCIIFNDVLEHLVDPYNALIYAKKLLKSNGKIIASIPNVRYFDNAWKFLVHKDWEYTQHGILDRTHLRFFTKKSILELFKSLQYSIEIIEGINPLEDEHPYHVRKFKLLNTIFLNHIKDMRYLQFAVVAHPNNCE